MCSRSPARNIKRFEQKPVECCQEWERVERKIHELLPWIRPSPACGAGDRNLGRQRNYRDRAADADARVLILNHERLRRNLCTRPPATYDAGAAFGSGISLQRQEKGLPMAKSGRTNAEKLAELISGIEAEAYERGRVDARKALLDRLTAGSGRGVRAGSASGGRTGKAAPPAGRAAGKRAPRGSVPRFVERVLNEHPGATAPEVAGHAVTPVERSVKLASIRVELHNGGKQGRYVSENGRWSLAVSDPPAGEPGQAALPDPSLGTAPGGGEMPVAAPVEGDDSAAGSGERDGKTLGLNL